MRFREFKDIQEKVSSISQSQADKLLGMIGIGGTDFAPPSKSTDGANLPADLKSAPGGISPQLIQTYLQSKGLDANHVAGIMTNIRAESGFRPGIVGDGGTSGGLFQHHNDRFAAMIKSAGGNPAWQTNWRGQIDFALSEPAGQQYQAQQFTSPQQASEWWTTNFEKPANAQAQAASRAQYAQAYAPGSTA